MTTDANKPTPPPRKTAATEQALTPAADAQSKNQHPLPTNVQTKIMVAASAMRPMSESAMSHFVIEASPEHTLDDTQTPHYLSRPVKEKNAKPGSRYTIRHPNHDFLVEGYIISVDKVSGSVHSGIILAVQMSELPQILASIDGAFVAQDSDGWTVRVDNVVLARGLSTAAQAEKWMDEKKAELRNARK